jgi:large subunit ribosomal protein L6
MSRIGNKNIEIPEKVTVEISSEIAMVKGPMGSLEIPFNSELNVSVDENLLSVKRPSDSRTHKSLHGTTRQLIANAISGVSEGFQKELEIRGVGYQANMDGNYLVLQLGYSHDIFISYL